MTYCYCICYIEREYYRNINRDLKARGYKNIRAIIPEVNVLRKTYKGKTYYERVPVLFNYGFIRMPIDKAYSRPYLIALRKAIPGIRNWLRSTETLFTRKKRKRIDNAEDFDDFSRVAICTREEVERFKKIARHNQLYSLEEVVKVQVGQYIHLKIYPYEGLEAKILKISIRTKKVTLQLYPQSGKFTIEVPLDHVIYSVYHNYDPDILLSSEKVDHQKLTSKAKKLL